MRELSWVSALAMAAVMVTGPLTAQEASTDQTTEEAADASDAPVAEAADGNATTSEGLSLGQSTEPQVGQTYIREEIGDWALRCVKTEEEFDPCQLYQLLVDGQGNSVAEFSIFPLEDDGPAVAGGTIVTPLETLLTEQIRLSVDGGSGKLYPFSFCTQIGCFSRVGFTEAEVASFRAGAQAQIQIVPAAASDQTVDLTVSLSGFTAGFEAVRAANAGQ